MIKCVTEEPRLQSAQDKLVCNVAGQCEYSQLVVLPNVHIKHFLDPGLAFASRVPCCGSLCRALLGETSTLRVKVDASHNVLLLKSAALFRFPPLWRGKRSQRYANTWSLPPRGALQMPAPGSDLCLLISCQEASSRNMYTDTVAGMNAVWVCDID